MLSAVLALQSPSPQSIHAIRRFHCPIARFDCPVTRSNPITHSNYPITHSNHPITRLADYSIPSFEAFPCPW
jgi:hypothetical protein